MAKRSAVSFPSTRTGANWPKNLGADYPTWPGAQGPEGLGGCPQRFPLPGGPHGFSTDLPTGVDEVLWTGETEAMLNARTSGRPCGAVAAIIIIL